MSNKFQIGIILWIGQFELVTWLESSNHSALFKGTVVKLLLNLGLKKFKSLLRYFRSRDEKLTANVTQHKIATACKHKKMIGVGNALLISKWAFFEIKRTKKKWNWNRNLSNLSKQLTQRYAYHLSHPGSSLDSVTEIELKS